LNIVSAPFALFLSINIFEQFAKKIDLSSELEKIVVLIKIMFKYLLAHICNYIKEQN